MLGDQSSRTQNYKKFLVNIMREKKVKSVLDMACGTGVDSVMLLEEGFRMTSSDASDKMLKGAHKTRWERRREPMFDDWVIEEANWLTLQAGDIYQHYGIAAVLHDSAAEKGKEGLIGFRL